MRGVVYTRSMRVGKYASVVVVRKEARDGPSEELYRQLVFHGCTESSLRLPGQIKMTPQAYPKQEAVERRDHIDVYLSAGVEIDSDCS